MTGKYYAGTLLLRNYNTAKSCVANKIYTKIYKSGKIPISFAKFHVSVEYLFSSILFCLYIFQSYKELQKIIKKQFY